MGQIEILASYREITGQEANVDEFRRIVADYELSAVLACCCRLHVALKTWRNLPDYQAESRLLPRLLPAHIVRRIAQLGPDKPTAFNRITLLFVIKQAILFATKDGKPIATQEDVERIGVCFLMANDLMLGYRPQRGDSFLQKVAGLMPFGDLLPRETPMEDMVRNHLLFSEILARDAIRTTPLYTDLLTMFRDKCGISYERFVGLVFGATTRYTLPISEEALMGEHPYLPPTFFRTTNATSSEVEAFFPTRRRKR